MLENNHSPDAIDRDLSQESSINTETEFNDIFDELESPSTPRAVVPSGVAPEDYIYPDPVSTSPVMKYLFKFIIYSPNPSFVQHFTMVDGEEFDKLILEAEAADIEHDVATFQQNWPRCPPVTGWVQYMRCLDVRWRHLRKGERSLNLNSPMTKEEKAEMKESLGREHSLSYVQELEAQAKSDYADQLFGPPVELVQVGQLGVKVSVS